MEKYFFILNDNCELKAQYLKYKAGVKIRDRFYDMIKSEFGIESDNYDCTRYTLYIQPTDADLELRGDIFRRSVTKMTSVKRSSDVYKKWMSLLGTVNFWQFETPEVWAYFNATNRAITNIFEGIDGEVYCHIVSSEPPGNKEYVTPVSEEEYLDALKAVGVAK